MIKKIIFSLLITLLALVAFGMYEVKKHAALKSQFSTQLCRVDFETDVDTALAAKINNHVRAQSHVKTSYFNIEDDG